jgi:uncharacterized protein (TIGR02466 family)
MDIQIQPILSEPVVGIHLDREFTDIELNLIHKLYDESEWNIGNRITNDQYVLDRSEFEELKKFIDHSLKVYVDEILVPKYPIEIYVTQSWFNYTEKNGYHHQHKHPNSFISGTFWIQTNPTDTVAFYKERFEQLKIYTDAPNAFTAEKTTFSAVEKKLLLFPSHLMHAVEPMKEDKRRISLAFNTFIRGTLGSYDGRSGLEL